MKERILTSLLTVFVISGIQAQAPSPVPRLVVGLTTIENEPHRSTVLYGERGFKRLLKEGRIYTNAEYDFHQCRPDLSATALIYTVTTTFIIMAFLPTAGWTWNATDYKSVKAARIL